ncbi:MAG TPA: SDR family NAD(P)-dependent oxidoreductase, partial [Bryobacteraceae bacterium]|nr:SDR family NAD(P)-dependent oxidoreductase [Bryobacteraceae bacterium]
MKLAGKVALVTGGGTGIGRAIAELFAAEGAKVAVNYSRSRDAAEEVVGGIRSKGGTAIAIGADVARAADAAAMVERVVAEFGRLDALVNNAGWSTRIPHDQLDNLTDEIWDRTFNTNLRGAFYCVRAAVPSLRKQDGASIINIASVAGMTGIGSSIAYA